MNSILVRYMVINLQLTTLAMYLDLDMIFSTKFIFGPSTLAFV